MKLDQNPELENQNLKTIVQCSFLGYVMITIVKYVGISIIQAAWLYHGIAMVLHVQKNKQIARLCLYTMTKC